MAIFNSYFDITRGYQCWFLISPKWQFQGHKPIIKQVQTVAVPACLGHSSWVSDCGTPLRVARGYLVARCKRILPFWVQEWVFFQKWAFCPAKNDDSTGIQIEMMGYHLLGWRPPQRLGDRHLFGSGELIIYIYIYSLFRLGHVQWQTVCLPEGKLVCKCLYSRMNIND